MEGPTGLLYEHEGATTRVLTEEAARRTTSILEGVLRSGTARRSALEGRVAAGKTGTQDNNTNAWFVGYTPELTTAVWVGHPDLYLQMENIPEFVAAGVPRVQGGTFPAAIWKATMDAALAGVPPSTFFAPLPNIRPAMRLFLPGVECPVAVTTAPPSTVSEGTGANPGDPSAVPSSTTSTSTTSTSTTTTTSTTIPGQVVFDFATTIPRGQTDPTWPVPTIDPRQFDIEICATAPTAPPSTSD